MGTLQWLGLQRPLLTNLQILRRKVSENFAFWIFEVILSAVKYYADTALGKVMRRIIMSEEYFIETAQRSGLKWENLP